MLAFGAAWSLRGDIGIRRNISRNLKVVAAILIISGKRSEVGGGGAQKHRVLERICPIVYLIYVSLVHHCDQMAVPVIGKSLHQGDIDASEAEFSFRGKSVAVDHIGCILSVAFMSISA